jgi:hypothetical protein
VAAFAPLVALLSPLTDAVRMNEYFISATNQGSRKKKESGSVFFWPLWAPAGNGVGEGHGVFWARSELG